VPWKVLREMRFASRYGVEIAMLIHIMWRRRSLRAFGEVALSVPLVDDANSDAVHTRMYTTIIGFVSDLLRTTRGHHGLLGYPEIGAFNTLGPMRSYIPSSTGTSSHLEDLPRDRILPSVQDIRLATRLAGG